MYFQYRPGTDNTGYWCKDRKTHWQLSWIDWALSRFGDSTSLTWTPRQPCGWSHKLHAWACDVLVRIQDTTKESADSVLHSKLVKLSGFIIWFFDSRELELEPHSEKWPDIWYICTDIWYLYSVLVMLDVLHCYAGFVCYCQLIAWKDSSSSCCIIICWVKDIKGNVRERMQWLFSTYNQFLQPSLVHWRSICFGNVAVCVSVTLMYCAQTTEQSSCDLHRYQKCSIRTWYIPLNCTWTGQVQSRRRLWIFSDLIASYRLILACYF